MQYYAKVSKEYKDNILYQYISQYPQTAIIIFANSITCCKRIGSLLNALGVLAYCLHSKMQ